MKIQLNNDIYFKLLVLFPIFTLFQGIRGLGFINKILLFALMFIQLFLQFKNLKIRKKWACIYFLLIITHIWALWNTRFPLYNSNMLVYFGFFELFSIYMIEKKDEFTNIIKDNVSYIFKIICIWNIIVGISIFMPSSYVINRAWGNERYFISITRDSFRLVPTALMITTLNLIYYIYTKNKKSIVWMIIPLFCFFMCGSRTYLGVGLIIFVIYWKIYVSKKKYFIFTIIPVAFLLGFFILNSAAASKIHATTYSSNSNFDFLGTVTNGRTIFWKVDLDCFSKENILKRLLGCGFNYDYYVTDLYYTSPHWAHNDFISILLNFGYVGIVIYLYTMLELYKEFLFKKEHSIIVKGLVILAWFINAMFNMFYTYTCSMICFPLMLIILKENLYDKKE